LPFLDRRYPMRAVIFYATREGQTRRIAEHVAAEVRARAHDVELYDVRTLTGSIDWPAYDWACVAASVHAGHHEPEMIAFVRSPRQALEQLEAAFLSVTLSEAGEGVHAPKERRGQAAADAQRMIGVLDDVDSAEVSLPHVSPDNWWLNDCHKAS
jgi:menaquinone-dependent protoporphyrinogen IX oxidase